MSCQPATLRCHRRRRVFSARNRTRALAVAMRRLQSARVDVSPGSSAQWRWIGAVVLLSASAKVPSRTDAAWDARTHEIRPRRVRQHSIALHPNPIIVRTLKEISSSLAIIARCLQLRYHRTVPRQLACGLALCGPDPVAPSDLPLWARKGERTDQAMILLCRTAAGPVSHVARCHRLRKRKFGGHCTSFATDEIARVCLFDLGRCERR